MVMDTARMRRQVARWQRQSDAGEMPDEIYDAIASDTKGIERRQVINLAKESAILDSAGNLRTYGDFKQDWAFDKSIYEHGMGTCALCGKTNIREQCVLRDEKRNKRIIVGNSCVERYIDIDIDGDVLDADAKTAFLRGKMKDAKHRFKQDKFTAEHPDALTKLRRYLDWGERDSEVKKLIRAVTKRLMSHGYPGPKVWRQWNKFTETSEARFAEFQEDERVREQKRRDAIRRHEENASRLANKLAERRKQFSDEADHFRSAVEEVNKDLQDWERSAAARAERTIRNGGLARLTEGMTRLVHSIQSRADFQTGDLVIDDTGLIEIIDDWLAEPDFLSQWETTFCNSIRNRRISGVELTDKQEAVCARISARWGA